MSSVLDGIIESAELDQIEADTREKILDAACGLTTIEAENAFALSVAECRHVDPAHISKETKAWLATQPPGRFESNFTPKHGSWLNLI